MDVCYTITEKVADANGVNQADLEPMYEVVDIDLVQSLVDSTSMDDVAIVFDYCEHQITVFASGHVEMDELSTPVRSWENAQQ